MTPIRQAVVLAGGRGTRLGTTTAEIPKPLLPVGGRPFIEWVIDNLGRQGVTDVILTIGYRAEMFSRWLTERRGPVNVETFVEEAPLDTGGALVPLSDSLGDAFFLLNGDTLFDAPLQELASYLGDSETLAAIALRPMPDTDRYGRVELEADTITGFAEKSASGPGLINGGVYALRKGALSGYQAPFSIEKDLFPELVRTGRVKGLPCDGFFVDIGLPETLHEAQQSVPTWWRSLSDT